MHIAPFDNKNKPIVDIDDPTVPLNYFNIVKLTKGQAFEYAVPGFETCIVPATGTVDVNVEGFKCDGLGQRTEDVWDGEPEGVYVPTAAKAIMVCTSAEAEIFIAGARYDKILDAFTGVFDQTHPIINKINDDFVYSESKKKEVAMLVARYTLGSQIEYCLRTTDSCNVNCEY